MPRKTIEFLEPLPDDEEDIKASGNWRRLFTILVIAFLLAGTLLITQHMFAFFRENPWVVWTIYIVVVVIIAYALVKTLSKYV
ncbi:hypothetical protein ACFLV6_00280 [Chloroflexota bacterium]